MGTLQHFFKLSKKLVFFGYLVLIGSLLSVNGVWAGDNECSGADYDVTVVGYSGSCNIDGSPSTVVLYNVDAPDYCKDISNIVIGLPDGSLAYVNTDHTLAYSPAFFELAVNLDTFNNHNISGVKGDLVYSSPVTSFAVVLNGENVDITADTASIKAGKNSVETDITRAPALEGDIDVSIHHGAIINNPDGSTSADTVIKITNTSTDTTHVQGYITVDAADGYNSVDLDAGGAALTVVSANTVLVSADVTGTFEITVTGPIGTGLSVSVTSANFEENTCNNFTHGTIDAAPTGDIVTFELVTTDTVNVASGEIATIDFRIVNNTSNIISGELEFEISHPANISFVDNEVRVVLDEVPLSCTVDTDLENTDVLCENVSLDPADVNQMHIQFSPLNSSGASSGFITVIGEFESESPLIELITDEATVEVDPALFLDIALVSPTDIQTDNGGSVEVVYQVQNNNTQQVEGVNLQIAITNSANLSFSEPISVTITNCNDPIDTFPLSCVEQDPINGSRIFSCEAGVVEAGICGLLTVGFTDLTNTVTTDESLGLDVGLVTDYWQRFADSVTITVGGLPPFIFELISEGELNIRHNEEITVEYHLENNLPASESVNLVFNSVAVQGLFGAENILITGNGNELVCGLDPLGRLNCQFDAQTGSNSVVLSGNFLNLNELGDVILGLEAWLAYNTPSGGQEVFPADTVTINVAPVEILAIELTSAPTDPVASGGTALLIFTADNTNGNTVNDAVLGFSVDAGGSPVTFDATVNLTDPATGNSFPWPCAPDASDPNLYLCDTFPPIPGLAQLVVEITLSNVVNDSAISADVTVEAFVTTLDSDNRADAVITVLPENSPLTLETVNEQLSIPDATGGNDLMVDWTLSNDGSDPLNYTLFLTIGADSAVNADSFELLLVNFGFAWDLSTCPVINGTTLVCDDIGAIQPGFPHEIQFLLTNVTNADPGCADQTATFYMEVLDPFGVVVTSNTATATISCVN